MSEFPNSSSSASVASEDPDEETGYPAELFVNPVLNDFMCAVCTDVARCPMKCRNEHIFCKFCINSWLENHGTCPTCSTGLTQESLTVARIAANVLAEHTVRCLSRCCASTTP
jgi:hypothetical protein